MSKVKYMLVAVLVALVCAAIPATASAYLYVDEACNAAANYAKPSADSASANFAASQGYRVGYFDRWVMQSYSRADANNVSCFVRFTYRSAPSSRAIFVDSNVGVSEGVTQGHYTFWRGTPWNVAYWAP